MFQEFEENDKSEEFLSDFRNKINQQSLASFQEKKEEVARSKNILIGALSGVVLAGIVGFIAFSPRYEGEQNKELPVIRRPQTAVKVQPLEPGGMEIANKDKSIYDIIEKKVDDTNQTVESILPPPQEVKAPVVAKADETVSVEDIINEAEAKAKPEAEAKIEAKAAEEKTAATAPAPAPQKTAEKIDIPKPVAIKQPKAEPKKPAPEQKTKDVAPIKTAATASKGQWQVQIMSSQNKKAIETSKSSLAKKYSALKGVPIFIEDAIIAGKGTFYRLKAGAYKTKPEAEKLCSDLKKSGLSCFIKQK